MNDDYDVGYGKPPKHSQFKSGQSGNPKGRPKGAKNLKTYLHQEAMTIVEYKENGQIQKASKLKILVMQLFSESLKGKSASQKAILELLEKYPLAESAQDSTEQELGPEDLKNIDDHIDFLETLREARDGHRDS